MAASHLSFAIDQTPITSARIILCEGSGDKSFLEHLITERNLPPFYVTHPIENVHPGGRNGFEQRLRSLRLQPGFDNVTGVLVISDNDANPNGAFQAVRKLIHDAEFDAPNHPLVCVPGPPVVCVFMMPAPDVKGQLETLFLQAIRDAWSAQFKCAMTYAECVGIGTWSQNKREKAQIRALVSHICKKDPYTGLPYLWSDGREVVVPLAHKAFDGIAKFLQGFDAAIAAITADSAQ